MRPFRRAKPAPLRWNAAKTLLQIAAFWWVFLFAIPPIVVRVTRGFMPSMPPGGALQVVAAVAFVAASALGLWSAWTMVTLGRGTPLPLDAPRHLVVAGPYRVVRNPMAVAGLFQGLAVATWLGSVPVALFFLAGVVLWHVVARPLEERDLRETFGAAFDEYRANVPLWFPRWR